MALELIIKIILSAVGLALIVYFLYLCYLLKPDCS